MLALKVNNSPLDLPPNTSINITMNNPIFDKEAIGRVYSYQFKVPATPKNKSIFQHRERLDTQLSSVSYPAELYIQGILFETGELKLTSSTEKYYKFSFQNLPFTLFEELGKIKLKDLNYPAVDLGYEYQPAFVFEVFIQGGNGIESAIEINGVVYTSPNSDNMQIVNAINADYPGAASFLDQLGNSFRFLLQSSQMPGIPTITLNPASTDPNTTHYFLFNYAVDGSGDAIGVAWQQHLNDIITNESTHICPVIHSPVFFKDDENIDYSKYVNYYNESGEYPFNTEYHLNEKKSQHSIVPYLFLKTVLNAMIGVSGVSSVVSELVIDNELNKIIIHNNQSVDDFPNFEEDIAQYITDYEYTGTQVNYRNTWKNSLDLGNHLPDIATDSFLIKLSSTFCLYYTFKNGRLSIEYCKTPLKTNIEDWTKKSQAEYIQKYKEYEGITLDYDRQDDEEDYPDQLQKNIIDQGITEVNSEWFSMHQIETSPFGLSGRIFLVPTLQENGTSSAYNISNAPSLRLLFYRGLQPDDNNVLYPLASHSNINLQGDQIGQYTLNWGGETGLYENFWKDFLELMTKGRTVSKVMNLSLQDLLNIKEFKNPRKRIQHPNGNITAVVKTVQFKVSTSGISPAKVTLITES